MSLRCLNPKVINTYMYNSALDLTPHGIKRIFYHIVPCGHCVNCLMNDSLDWTLRLVLEAEVAETAWFITLTFDENNVRPVCKEDVQRFMNSLRKKYKRLCEEKGISINKLGYFAVGEYGREENRPHYHLVLFDFPCSDWRALQSFIEDVWHRGFVQCEPLSVQTAGYIAKYLTKIDPRDHGDNPPFRVMSLKPAIGYTYFYSHPEIVGYLNQAKRLVITLRNGRKFRVPRSIRRKFLCLDRQLEIREYGRLSREDVDSFLTKDYLTNCRQENERKLNRIKRKFKE